MADERTTERGGYYHNGIRAWRERITRELRRGERRAETLRRIGSSCADDHDAAMNVLRQMLAVLEKA